MSTPDIQETLLNAQQNEKKPTEAFMRAVRVMRLAAAVIADKTSHGYKKHHRDADEFNNPRYGRPLGIHSIRDLQQHAFNVLASRDTEIVHPYGTKIYAYHEPSETIVILNSKQGRMKLDGGTMFRSKHDSGPDWYRRLTRLEAEWMGVDGFPVKQGGFGPSLLQDEDLATRMESRYAKLYARKKHISPEEALAQFRQNAEDMVTPKQNAPAVAKTVAQKPVAHNCHPSPVR
ncbi:MAG: hypothetical protein GC185_13580 [Alphaproteobacteria bacterium]|nr:hypothetical protein [Alphaproteobacteria bacterium]